jgi:hypothetical protein
MMFLPPFMDSPGTVTEQMGKTQGAVYHDHDLIQDLSKRLAQRSGAPHAGWADHAWLEPRRARGSRN